MYTINASPVNIDKNRELLKPRAIPNKNDIIGIMSVIAINNGKDLFFLIALKFSPTFANSTIYIIQLRLIPAIEYH